MKIQLQWALKNPQGWQEIDSSNWRNIPKRPIPKKGQLGGLDNVKGWIRNVNVQGITNEGFDHVAVEEITIGNDTGVKMTSWNDDPDDYPVGKRQAIVWTILPLAPDPKLGMAINTRQSCVRYAEGERYNRLLAFPPQNTTVRPWSEFIAPSEEITRHGIWMEDIKLKKHIDKAPHSEWGWMHWNEHLPESEVELDKLGRRILKEQRKQGRYHQAEHTITYYQRNTDRATSATVATNEDAFELTAGGSETESVTTDSGAVTVWSFQTDTNQPNSADWPSGAFHQQINCTAASTGLIYGTGQSGASSNIGFRRTDSNTLSLTNILITSGNGDFNDFSGTGLKLTTSDITDVAAGNATDRFMSQIAATGDSHGDAITIQFNSDSYADGPWTAAGGDKSVNVFDTVNISENIQTQLVNNASVVDNVTVAETIQAQLVLNINVFDSIQVSEDVTTRTVLSINVFDTVQVSEAITAQAPDVFISVTDLINVSESVTPQLVNNVSVVDLVNVSESITSMEVYMPQVADNITVSESVTPMEIDNVNVFDLINVSESVTVVIPTLTISVVDNVTVAESTVLMEVNNVSVVDNVTVTENITVNQANLIVSVSDNVAVSEAVTLSETDYINVVDNITVTENITAIVPSGNASVVDNITVAESISTLIPSGNTSVFDNVQVSEAVTVFIPTLTINIFDNVTVSELVTVQETNLIINFFDEVFVSENVSTLLLSPGAINVADDVYVSESVSVLIPILHVSVADLITVAEDVSVNKTTTAPSTTGFKHLPNRFSRLGRMSR